MPDVRKGTKVDPSKMNRAKMGLAVAQPPQQGGEVEGQYRYVDLVACPCYGHVVWAELDSNVYEWFSCGVCGCTFTA